jgi:hypothetical protein
MSLTNLYRDQHRPHEAGMTITVEQAKDAAVIDHLEKRGSLIEKITVRHLPRQAHPGVSLPLSCPFHVVLGFAGHCAMNPSPVTVFLLPRPRSGCLASL